MNNLKSENFSDWAYCSHSWLCLYVVHSQIIARVIIGKGEQQFLWSQLLHLISHHFISSRFISSHLISIMSPMYFGQRHILNLSIVANVPPDACSPLFICICVYLLPARWASWLIWRTIVRFNAAHSVLFVYCSLTLLLFYWNKSMTINDYYRAFSKLDLRTSRNVINIITCIPANLFNKHIIT